MAKKLIIDTYNTILNFFFPQKCLGCGIKNKSLCDKCLKKIDYPTLPEKDNIFAATDYNDAYAKKAIWLLKYKKMKEMAKPIAKLIYQRNVRNIDFNDAIIIPIPLSKKRMKERGFNQSELIAKHLSDMTSFSMLANILYKKSHTETQVSIKDKKERLNNLKDSFAVKNEHLIKGGNIILIDDVSTTGATINESRKILRAFGAKKILSFVAARG